MKTIPKTIEKDPAARLAFLEEFVGFTREDWATLAESAGVLGPALPKLMDAIYDHLLSFDDTRRIFLGATEDVDPQYIAIRKEHLSDWVLRTISEPTREQFANYLAQVGRRHTATAGDTKRSVPPRYMVMLTSFVQTALISTLFEALPGEPEKVRRYALAWNRMMMIQLEMFLKALAPHYPNWD